MNGDGKCKVYTKHPVQPPDEEWIMPDGIFYKRLYCEEHGMIVPQHSHEYGHTTLIVRGKFLVWADDKQLGVFKAPHPLWIAPGVKHTFVALLDHSEAFCIHNTEPVVTEEHQLVESV